MAIFDELKSIGKVLQEAGKIEQYQQILDTQDQLLKMQKRITELEGENKILVNMLEIHEKIVFENDRFYYLIGEDQKKDGPFCQPCYDSNSKLIRLQPWGLRELHCMICKNSFKKL